MNKADVKGTYLFIKQFSKPRDDFMVITIRKNNVRTNSPQGPAIFPYYNMPVLSINYNILF